MADHLMSHFLVYASPLLEFLFQPAAFKRDALLLNASTPDFHKVHSKTIRKTSDDGAQLKWAALCPAG